MARRFLDYVELDKSVNRLIAEDANWRPLIDARNAEDANWRPAGDRRFRRL